jgi:hypothetical protein
MIYKGFQIDERVTFTVDDRAEPFLRKLQSILTSEDSGTMLRHTKDFFLNAFLMKVLLLVLKFF